jgi:hypothetical protein
MAKSSIIALAGIACVVVALADPASAQRRMTVDELLKPYDAKTRPDYVPPPTPPAPAPEVAPMPIVRSEIEQQELLARAQKLLAESLKDPEAARFQDVVIRADAVCGYMNGKNSYGGYIGYTPFAYKISTGRIVIVPILNAASRASDFEEERKATAFIKANCRI